ncbi:kptA [Symbiodinium microadriaticum]|nr:kptA [Symbiodinium microadriaticum]
MIKTSVAVANNTRMSLELLSSRVNMRKTISMETGGKTRLADVRPVAEALARSAVVYQHCEKEVLHTQLRWKAPDPKQLVRADVQKHNPSLGMTAAQRWAVKYNSALTTAARAWRSAHAGGSDLLLAVLFGEDRQERDQAEENRPQMLLLAELCGRSAWLVRLRRQAGNGQDGFHYVLSPSMEFVPSLDAVAAQKICLRGSRRRALSLAVLGWQHVAADQAAAAGIFVFHAMQILPVSHLRLAGAGSTRSAPAAPAVPPALGDDAPDSESDGAGDDDEKARQEEAATAASLRMSVVHNPCAELMAEIFEGADNGNSDVQILGGPDAARDIEELEQVHRRFVAAAAEKRQEERNAAGRGTDSAGPDDDQVSFAGQGFSEDEDGDVLDSFLNGETMREEPSACRARETLSPPALVTALQRWLEGASFDAENLAACLGPPLALLLHAQENSLDVDFISWVKPHKDLKFRVVQLDEQDGVVYPSHFVKPMPFQRCVFLMHVTGARVRKKERETMGAEPIRFRDMCRVIVDSAGDLPALDSSQGVACNTSGDVHRCGFCLQFWHRHCSEQLAPSVHRACNAGSL